MENLHSFWVCWHEHISMNVGFLDEMWRLLYVALKQHMLPSSTPSFQIWRHYWNCRSHLSSDSCLLRQQVHRIKVWFFWAQKRFQFNLGAVEVSLDAEKMVVFLAHIHTWLLSARYSFQFQITQGTVLKSSWASTVVSSRESFLFLIQCCLKITSIHFWPLTLSLSLQCGRHDPQSHGNLTLSNIFLHVFLNFRCSLLHFGQPLPISRSERLLLDPELLLSYLIGSQLLLQLFFIRPS